MTWTYTNAPSTSQRDEIRLLCGDTVAGASPTLSDEEIAYFLASEGSSVGAAIMGCEALAAAWLGRPESESTGGISISRGDMARKFSTQANLLRRSKLRPVPYLGGMSTSDKQTDEQDSDKVGPRFFRGQGRDTEAMSSYPGQYDDEATS